MDWSLVLASQGIEVVIEQSPELGWGLIVPATDGERAAAAIRQYVHENRHWRWRQPMFRDQVVFDWSSLGWVVAMVLCDWGSVRAPNLRDAGIMDGDAVVHGQWWRLFTAMFFHADLGHLAANAGFGLILLGLAMGRFGGGVALLASFLAGAMGNLVAMALDPGHRSLGASGMVMGCLGLLAAQSVPALRKGPYSRKLVISSFIAGVMLFVLLGLDPESDVVAHGGGFVGGVMAGGLLLLFPKTARSRTANFVCGLLFGILAGLTGCLVLMHPTAPGLSPG